MLPRREDLHVQVIDEETRDPLPDATLVYRYKELGEEHTDSVRADASGIATIPQMRYCATVDLAAHCHGYADTLRTDAPCQEIVAANDSTALPLRPIKQRFTFFVKNKETRQPIPDATAIVTLTYNGRKIQRTVHTSTDGKGIAAYDSAFVLATVAIHASKIHFHDGDLEGGPFTVEQFVRQDDDTRTVWLEPEPYTCEFVIVDSITGRPVEGVRNRIKITDPSGKTETVEEISNRNGVIPVKAKEGSRIEIISEKEPAYKKHSQVVPKFKDKEKIRMTPNLVSLEFRTINGVNGKVLPDCALSISASITGRHAPTNSGNGVFTVDGLQRDELLSITASKPQFGSNSTKVRNAPVNTLMTAPQDRRDIPLKPDLPPCQGGTITPRKMGQPLDHKQTYNMGQHCGDFVLHGDAYSQADHFIVYDGPTADPSRQIFPKPGQNNFLQDKFSLRLHFTDWTVTVVVKTYNNNSEWKYMVDCPTAPCPH